MEAPASSAGEPIVQDYSQDAPTEPSSLTQHSRPNHAGRFNEDFDAVRPSTSTTEGDHANTNIKRSDSVMSQSNTLLPSRGGTLRKKQSLKKSSGLRRSSSRRSLGAGSMKSLALGERERYADGHGQEIYSAFFTPIPTSGNPTEMLANRFQAWRKVLKDLLTYFREIQKSYESRSKALISASNVINSITTPPLLLAEGGIGDALQTLRQYHKQGVAEANKARNIEEDVIVQLSGLRSDLQQKIKEIKNLSGDFKNNVDKETEITRRTVRDLQEALGLVDTAPSATTGKGDPFLVKLAVDRQVEKQIDEENYLHRAFLNLENSGRELESIVVGEIQKAYNAYAGIIKREADEAYETVETLRSGPLAMAKDAEWDAFIQGNEHFVNPSLPVRTAYQIEYPGQNSPAAVEVRSGMLERKSKYLKSYTPGWYVLSPTHLHEFKSAERINYQSPVMSLYLPEQKLGSHSSTDSSSHKFMLKGRQTGGMHRGHGWVFRAESQDTMLAWYEDIKNLTEKTGEERNAFVRKHTRSVSAGSKAGSVNSDWAMEEDEADQTPYSATTSQLDPASPQEQSSQRRPKPGGRFPSDLNVNRGLRVPLSPSSGTSSDDHDVIAAARAVPGSEPPFVQSQDYIPNEGYAPDGDLPHRSGPTPATSQENHATEYDSQPVQSDGVGSDGPGQVAYASTALYSHPREPTGHALDETERPHSYYGEWMNPAAAARRAAAAVGTETHQHRTQEPKPTSSTAPGPLDRSTINRDPGPVIATATLAPTPELPADPATTNPAPVPTTSAPTTATGTSTAPAHPQNVSTLFTTPSLSAEPEQVSPAAPVAGDVTPRAQSVTRPPLDTRHSASTISDLHVPGEFPRRSESGSSI